LVFLVISFSMFYWASWLHDHVFLQLLVLWQKESMLVKVLHHHCRSWWIQWGCYGSWSIPYIFLKVMVDAYDCVNVVETAP
jgi:hypothetical protein